MNARIHASLYKDQPAITMESETATAQFLPGIGAKMCSLVFKPANAELLLQRPLALYKLAPYDGDYVAQGECSGLDEMFPSIDPCFYYGYPWHGTPIPDHGEVWSLPWDFTIDGQALHFTTYGVRFPYRLEKRVSFTDVSTLHTSYRLTNLSNFDLDFVWAAHAMLNLEEGAELSLPEGVQQVTTALRGTGTLGNYGDTYDWPTASLPDGSRHDLHVFCPKSSGHMFKYFIRGKMPAGWCTLSYPSSAFRLRLSFPAEQVPYLAVLPDEGGWQDLYAVFLEPMTGAFDRLDIAQAQRKCSTVRARASCEWYLDYQMLA